MSSYVLVYPHISSHILTQSAVQEKLWRHERGCYHRNGLCKLQQKNDMSAMQVVAAEEQDCKGAKEALQDWWRSYMFDVFVCFVMYVMCLHMLVYTCLQLCSA